MGPLFGGFFLAFSSPATTERDRLPEEKDVVSHVSTCCTRRAFVWKILFPPTSALAPPRAQAGRPLCSPDRGRGRDGPRPPEGAAEQRRLPLPRPAGPAGAFCFLLGKVCLRSRSRFGGVLPFFIFPFFILSQQANDMMCSRVVFFLK